MNTIDQQQGNDEIYDEMAFDGVRINNDIEQPQLPVDASGENSRTFFHHIPGICWSRAIVLFVHVSFVAVSVMTPFFDDRSNDSKGTFWIAGTDESVFQHLKMVLWPWLLLLFPMDIVARVYLLPKGGARDARTWYCRSVSASSWLSLCLATIVAMLSAMLLIAVVWAIFYYAGSKSLVVDIFLFLVAIIGGAILRIYLLKQEVGMDCVCLLIGWHHMVLYLFLLF
jgi:hypothetical protein